MWGDTRAFLQGVGFGSKQIIAMQKVLDVLPLSTHTYIDNPLCTVAYPCSLRK